MVKSPGKAGDTKKICVLERSPGQLKESRMKGKCPGDVWRSCSEAGIVWGGERREGVGRGGKGEARPVNQVH